MTEPRVSSVPNVSAIAMNADAMSCTHWIHRQSSFSATNPAHTGPIPVPTKAKSENMDIGAPRSEVV